MGGRADRTAGPRIGRVRKSPSVFVRRIRFVRDYEIRDGVSLPAYIHGAVETRLAGRAELAIWFSGFTRMDYGDSKASRLVKEIRAEETSREKCKLRQSDF